MPRKVTKLEVDLPDVFGFIDYREYLQAVFEACKEQLPRFSYRAFSRLAGSTSPNFLQLILARKMAPSAAQMTSLTRALGLGSRQTRFLKLLVSFDKAGTLEKREQLLRKALRTARHTRVRTLTEDQYEYYAEWYHSALRAVLGFYRMKHSEENYAELAGLLWPPIPARRVEESLQLLLRLGLVKVDSDGYYVQSEAVVTTGDELQSMQVLRYQAESMKLAVAALQECPPEERDISTLTVNISADGFRKLKGRLQAFRKEIIAVAEGDVRDDRVYQMNLQLFPLALPGDERREHS